MDNNAQHSHEKRQFTRVAFVNRISLVQQPLQWQGNVVDISFNGVLINCNLHDINLQQSITGHIVFETREQISVTLQHIHHYNNLWGFQFDRIEQKSLECLNRLMAEHLSTDACQRELKALFSYHQ